MRMYVWSVKPSWIAVAHADDVTHARRLLLSGDLGHSGDGSCIVRDKAREYVLTQQPTHWIGANAEFALTDSAELEQAEYHVHNARKMYDELWDELEARGLAKRHPGSGIRFLIAEKTT